MKSKCDFCEQEATSFGSYACYQACASHKETGLNIEMLMWKALEGEEEE